MSRRCDYYFFAMRGSRNLCQRGWGGGEARLPKNNCKNVFLKPSTDFTVIHGGPTFFRGGGPTFPGGGGGGPDAYFHKNACNL